MKENLKKYGLVAIKGACMGASDVIPGVSGGTIAFMTGIYSELIDSIHNIDGIALKLFFTGRFREFWKHINGNFLISLLVGILFSVFSLAKLMTWLLENQPAPTWAFFFGLIVASSIFILKGVHFWKWKDYVCTLAGVVLGAVVCTLSPSTTPDGLWFIFLCGAIAICAMILPGISGSFILLIMGKYDYVLAAVSGLVSLGRAEEVTAGLATGSMTWGQCLTVMLVFACGAVIGIVSFSKFLHWLLARRNRETTLVLAGFIIGSLLKVWPWHAESGWPALPGVGVELDWVQVGLCTVTAAAGLALVFGIEYLSKHKESSK